MTRELFLRDISGELSDHRLNVFGISHSHEHPHGDALEGIGAVGRDVRRELSGVCVCV